MDGILGRGVAMMVLAWGIFQVSVPDARADDPAFLTIGAGYYDVHHKKDDSAEIRLEYRSDMKIWEVKPFAALAGTTNGSFFVGAGVLMDVYFGRRWVLTPSLAPHYYHAGGTRKKLGHKVEFRSQLELAYRFDDRSRLGLSFSHYSNAGLGKKNPGSETLLLNYSVPTTTISEMLE